MLRATTLHGRSIVDLDSAAKLGQLEELILDPEAGHVAGLVVGQGPALLGDRRQQVLPAAVVHAIGPDAVTVHAGSAGQADTTHLGALPRLSSLLGRKVVSQSGKFFGHLGDALIAREDGRIIGYTLEPNHPAGRLFGARSDDFAGYVRADRDLRIGPDLVVAPDDALVSERPAEDDPADDRAAQPPAARRWLGPRPARRAEALEETVAPAAPEGDRVVDVPVRRVPVREVQTRDLSS